MYEQEVNALILSEYGLSDIKVTHRFDHLRDYDKFSVYKNGLRIGGLKLRFRKTTPRRVAKSAIKLTYIVAEAALTICGELGMGADKYIDINIDLFIKEV